MGLPSLPRWIRRAARHGTAAASRPWRHGVRTLLSGVLLPALLLPALLATGPARAAVQPSDLPPVDSVFVPSARATSRDRIEVRWTIADGYYLYRHRTAVEAIDGGFGDARLVLPPGDRHQDEFFGEVETYRGQLVARLEGAAAAGADTVRLRIRYQGCADAGVCYPPQTRTLTVALPPAGGDAPAPAGRGGLAGLARALGGGSPAAAGEPLPEREAFGFDAIVGDGNTLLLRFRPARGYYLYRDRSRFTVEGAPGITAGRPRWPPGTAHHDEHFGDVTVYFDEADVTLPLRRTRPDAARITLRATFQGCQTDGICYPPMTRTVALDLPAGTVGAAGRAAGTPEPDTAAPNAAPAESGAGADGDPSTARAAGQAARSGGGAAPAADVPAADPSNASSPDATAATPTAAPPAATRGLLASLLLALLGGLALNLMPCVLPVLSLKALSLANSGESRARARAHALWYTAGVVLAFLALGVAVLAVRAAGLALGWGFQLQQPVVVAALALLLFALGLSLSGVWYASVGLGARGQALMQRSGPAGDFATGVLAVVLATPCIGPFMGAALAYAFAGPAAGGLLVFAMLGLGLALPFLAIGFVPALAHRLPKPGAWMDTFKQLMAFPLYLTAAWLAWVLAEQRGADAVGLWMVSATAVALAAWAWTRRQAGARWGGAVAALALLAALLPLWRIHQLPRPAAGATAASEHGAVPYSERRLASLRAQGRVVFVNMTADWCVSCKANEKAVFGRDAFRQALAEADAVYMVGDYTDVDPAITAYLQRHRAVGVPLYVVYPAGGGEGEVLPTLLTPTLAREALARAAGR